MKNNLSRIVAAVATLFLILACSLQSKLPLPALPTAMPTATQTATSTATPPPATPTPQVGVGVPVSVGKWQIAIENTQQESAISGGYYPNRRTYTPKSGLTFLIVKISVRSLEPGQSLIISSAEVAVIDKNGGIHSADGGGFSDTDLCASCKITITGTGAVLSASIVFVVPKDLIQESWKLQYKDSSPLPFSLGTEPSFPLKTEVGPFDDYLPSTCNLADVPKPLGNEGLLTFERWEGNSLVLEAMPPGGSARTQVCAGIAYGETQWGSDGAALLLLGPLQGWPSLSLVEPNGEVTALVRNGKDIWAKFDSSSRYILFSTNFLGEDVEKLFVFDRQTGLVTLLKEGQWLAARFLAGGKLVISVRPLDGETETYIGGADGGNLSLVSLPNNAGINMVTADGAHVIYVEGEYPTMSLVLANLDGSEKRELATVKDNWGNNGILSLDGKFILYSHPKDNKKEAVLLNLETGKEFPIVSQSNELRFNFSLDSQWGLVFSTAGVDSASDADKKQEYTLYVLKTGTGEVVHELRDVENAYFSADGQRLACVTLKPDGTMEVFVLTLADGSTTSLGGGHLTGWWPLIVAP